MRKAINKKLMILVLATLSAIMMMLGVGITTVKANVTPKSVNEISFEMVDAAQVRLEIGGRNGMRFAGKMSASDYSSIMAYGYESIEYGVFIMPSSYVTDHGALNKENAIEGAKYVYGSQYTEPTYDDNGTTKYRILHTETMAVSESDGNYYTYGSVHNVLAENLATAYTACAYIKATPVEGEVEYKFAEAMTNNRSMLEVAFRAINSGDYDDTEEEAIVAQRAILDGYKTSYVNYLGSEPTYSYTVNYMVEGNAIPVKTETVDGVKMNTAIPYSAPIGYALDCELVAADCYVYVEDVTLNVNVKPLEEIKLDLEPAVINKNGTGLLWIDTGVSLSGTKAVSVGGVNYDLSGIAIKNNESGVTNAMLGVSVAATPASVSGETELKVYLSDKIYVIPAIVADVVATTADQLKAALTNSTTTEYIVLGADIENFGEFAGTQPMHGTLDGRGFAVKGMVITGNPLITTLAGTLKNVAFIDTVQTSNAAGATLITDNLGTIDNVFLSGTIYNSAALTHYSSAAGASISNVVIKAEWDKNSTTTYKTGNTGGLLATGATAKANAPTITNVYGLSGTVVNMYGLGWVMNTTLLPYTENNALLAALGETMPNGFNAYWSIKDGSLYFGDELVVKKLVSEELELSADKHDLFYFSKDVTTLSTNYAASFVEDGNYNVALPKDIGSIASVALGTVELGGAIYDSASKTVKIPVASISSIANGNYTIVITTEAGDIYTSTAVVADYVITTASEFINIFKRHYK